MIPVGLVGAGTRAAEVYAPALETCPEVDFVAVWARAAEPVRRLAERHGVVPCADGRSHGLGIEHGLHLQRLVESAETDLVLYS